MLREVQIIMRRCYAGFSSLTLALKGKRLLDGNAIASEVIKKDAKRSKRGCSYALQIPCAHVRNCKSLFDKYGVSYIAIDEDEI